MLGINKRQLLSAGVIGAIIAIPHNNSIPKGYLECDGTTISRALYAKLFAQIGTLYGVGDGSTTFSIPDFRGEFLRGFDNGRGIDIGRGIGTFQTDKTAQNGLSGSTDSTGAHSHSFSSYSQPGTQVGVGEGIASTTNKGSSTSSAGSHSHTVTISGDNETAPRNMSVLYAIKY
mgnify:CR=1 FL=1